MILATVAVLGGALLIRVIQLGSDPPAFISRDFITDEGWWAHNARNAILYGQWRIDQHNPGLYSAYLYNFGVFLLFKILGVSFVTVRLLSAFAGWLTVVLLFALVRREIGARAGLFAAILLGLSNLHVMYSRTAFVESTMVFFVALMLYLWSLRKVHASFAFGAGLAFALAVLTKITAIYFIPGLILLAVAEMIRRSLRRSYVLLFIAGTALVGACYAIIFVAPDFHNWLQFNISNGTGSEWTTGPYFVYSVLKLPGSLFSAGSPVITGLTMVALGSLLLTISGTGLARAIRALGELELVGLSLLAGYSLSLSLTIYQPERRLLPALFLMVILAAGVLDKGWEVIRQIAREPDRLSAGAWFTLLFLLPAIAIVKFQWAGLGGPLTLRFWVFKLIPVAAMVVVSVAISRRKWPYPFRRGLLAISRVIILSLLTGFALVQVYKALTLWGLDQAAVKSSLWNHPVILALGALVGLACIAAVAQVIRPGPRLAMTLVAAFVVIEGVQVSGWRLHPTYTLQQAGATLAEIIKDDTIVTYYETPLIPSAARVICRSERRGFNVDAFERFNPQYTLILRRDNWKDYSMDEMPVEEWPPPREFVPARVAEFELCPTAVRGPRFILELYSLAPRLKKRNKAATQEWSRLE